MMASGSYCIGRLAQWCLQTHFTDLAVALKHSSQFLEEHGPELASYTTLELYYQLTDWFYIS